MGARNCGRVHIDLILSLIFAPQEIVSILNKIFRFPLL